MARGKERLSWGACKRAIAADGPYLCDGGGLYLQVRGAAGKSWVFRWTDRRTGKDRFIGLGSMSTYDIVEVREKARKCRQLLAEGKCPKAEKNGEELNASIRAGRVKTVKQVVDEFYDTHIAVLSRDTRVNFERYMKRYVLLKIGHLPFAKLTRDVILESGKERVGLKELWNRINPTGQRVRSHLEGMFSLAVSRGWYQPPNPMKWKGDDGLEHVLTDPKRLHKVEHRPALPLRDVGQFMQDLRNCMDRRGLNRSQRDSGRRIPTSLWLEFVVLSAVRISEARLATWDEMEGLDGPTPIWRVPPDHHKLGRGDHIIPITKPMLDVLHEMERRNGAEKGKLVLPSSFGGGNKPMHAAAMNVFVRLRMNWKTPITAHGFRSTFTDWAEPNYSYELISRQCGRIPHDVTWEAYARNPRVEERRVMMEAWGRYCSLPPAEAGQILPMRRKTAT